MLTVQDRGAHTGAPWWRMLQAASAVLDFAPRQVLPYHFGYPGGTGTQDPEAFKALVNAANPAINVIIGEWYVDA